MEELPQLIFVEGVDGSGKSELCNNLQKFFNEAGIDAIVSRRLRLPVLGELYRKCIFPEESGLEVDNHHTARMLLFAADAVNIAHLEIIPALEAGKLVICDRSIYSTFVYQHLVDGESYEYTMQAIQYFLDAIPEKYLIRTYTIFVDCPPEVALERINTRNSAKNRYDNISSLQKTREGYLKALEEFADFKYGIIDATKSPREVAEQALGKLIPYDSSKNISWALLPNAARPS